MVYLLWFFGFDNHKRPGVSIMYTFISAIILVSFMAGHSPKIVCNFELEILVDHLLIFILLIFHVFSMYLYPQYESSIRSI